MKKKILLVIPFCILTAIAISVYMLLPKVLAGDSVVQDLKLHYKVQDNKISLTVEDNNPSDTKIVVPLPKDISYQVSGDQAIGITEDTTNHQVVIDWIEGQAKEATLFLTSNKGGNYDFTAQTVRDSQPVCTEVTQILVPTTASKQEDSSTTINTSSSQEQSISDNNFMGSTTVPDQEEDSSTENTSSSSKQSSTEKNTSETSNNLQDSIIASGTSGTVNWEIDDAGVLIFSGGTFSDSASYSWNQYGDAIVKIKFTEPVIASKYSSNFFRNLYNAKEIENMNFLDTSHVIDMSNMFSGMSSLTSLDVTGFDTSQVTTMYFMFSEMSSLTSLDVTGFDTSQVKDMQLMFSGMSSLTSLDVTGFDTSQVNAMAFMFSGMSSLTSLDVTGFDTSQVANMNSMFSGTSSLTSLDVTGFDTSQVKSMSSMFSGMSSLTSLDVTGFDTSQVKDMSSMFSGMSSLTSLDVTGFDTSQVKDMSSMFSGMSSLTSLDVSNFDMVNLQKNQIVEFLNGTARLSSLKLGSKSKIASLPDIVVTNQFSGKWQSIGDGTSERPTGNVILSSEELMKKYENGGDVETYVWRPNMAPIFESNIAVKNLTSNDGKNVINDELEYSVDIKDTAEYSETTQGSLELLISGVSPDSPTYAKQAIHIDKDSVKVYDSSNKQIDAISTDLTWDSVEDAYVLKINNILNFINQSKYTVKYTSSVSQANYSSEKKLKSVIKYQYQDLLAVSQSYESSNVTSVNQLEGEQFLQSTLPEDMTAYTGDSVQFIKNQTLVLISTIENTGNERDLTLENWSVSDTLLDGYSKFQIDPSFFYVQENGTDWKKLSMSSNGNVNGNPTYGMNTSDHFTLKKGEMIKFKYRVTAKIGDEKETLRMYFHIPEASQSTVDFLDIISKSGLLQFKTVPTSMKFNDSIISNKTLEVKRNDIDWKISVEDTRLMKTNWRINAKLIAPFKNTIGEIATNQFLYYRSKNQSDQLIDSNSEVNVFEGKSIKNQDYYDVSWDDSSGPILKIAPGSIKADQYKGEIQWNLLDTPI
jgi:surface protein